VLPTGILKAVDVFEDRHFGVPTCIPRPSSDQLRLDHHEKGLDSGVVEKTNYPRPDIRCGTTFWVIWARSGRSLQSGTGRPNERLLRALSSHLAIFAEWLLRGRSRRSLQSGIINTDE